MKNISRCMLMICGLAMMFVVILLFGFFETNIPKITFMIIWFVCFKVITFAIGSDSKKSAASVL